MPIKPQPSHKPVVRPVGKPLAAVPPKPMMPMDTNAFIPIVRPVNPPTPHAQTPPKPVSKVLPSPTVEQKKIVEEVNRQVAIQNSFSVVNALNDKQHAIAAFDEVNQIINRTNARHGTPFKDTFKAAGVAKEWAKENAPHLLQPSQQSIIDEFNSTTYTIDPETQVTTDTKPFSVFFHRSGHETYWRCPRAYWLNYHYLGTGIYKAPIPLHLEVGSAVHHGFASILLGRDIEYAVTVAQQYLQHGERWPFLNPQYEQQEQLALIAGLLYSFYFYMWPQFQKQFKVLYVERGVVSTEVFDTGDGRKLHAHRMSRPDAILQDRHTNEIVGWSLKTINDLNEWKRQQFHNDLQGLTEMYNAEVMFSQIREAGPDAFVESWLGGMDGKPTYAQIKEKLAEWDTFPTQVDYIQTLFLVKGVRKPFGEVEEVSGLYDSPDYEEKEFRQHSPLCYYWQNNGEAPLGSPARAWVGRYYKPDNKSYNRLGKGFDRVPVWPSKTSPFSDPRDFTINIAVRDWVQRLNSSEVYPSTLPDDRNIRNPLSAIVVYDEPMYRNRTHMQTVVERQVAQVQTKIAFDLYDIQTALSAGQVDDAQKLVDANFDQHLTSCRQPYRCEFAKLCHETPEGWMDHKTMPEGFAERKPHHDFETEAREGK